MPVLLQTNEKEENMHNLNIELFNAINAGPNLSGFPLYSAIFIAKYLTYLVPLAMLAAWFWGKPRYRNILLFAILTACVAIVINKIIGFVWYQPRPFVLGLGHQYLAHDPSPSFPSDHTTFLWAIGASLLFFAETRLAAFAMLLVALLVGWSRVFVGIHFPADIIGGIFTATFAVLILDALRPWINNYLFPKLEALYRKIFAIAISKKLVKN